MATNDTALVHPIAGTAIAAELVQLGITHVIIVPDTHQRTLINAIADRGEPEMVRVATEDEAMAISAGLYMAGKRPMLLVQNTGFFASLNTLRAIAMEAQVPTMMFVGEFGRDITKPNSESATPRVRVIEPTLDLWAVPYYRVDAPGDLPTIALALNQSYEQRGPVIVLIGAPTS